MFLLQLLCLQSILAHAVTNDSTESLLEVVYWELKPFIFTNDDGQIDGIIPMMLDKAQHYCMNNTNDTAVLYKFKLKMNSRKEFYDLIRSNTSYGNDMLKNISKDKAFWIPVVAIKNKKMMDIEKTRGIREFQLVGSKHIAIIVERSYISLPKKIVRGFLNCGEIIVLACLLSFMLSMLMWLIESHHNEDVNECFLKGIGTTLWWSFVSMTTVGYGDVVPKSIIGRCVAVVWIFTGVMIGCMMTATMTDELSGIGDLNLKREKITVLENSYEELVANDYGLNIIPVASYEKVVDMVRTREVFAGMINGDVAAWYQTEITNDSSANPLRIVKILPAYIDVNCYVAADIKPVLKTVFRCMAMQQDEVYKASINRFRKHCKTEVLFIGSMKEFIKESHIRLLILFASIMFFTGLIYDVIRKKYRRKRLQPPAKYLRKYYTTSD